MKTEQVLKHYGTQMEVAKALGITQPTVSEWGEYPPVLRQIQIERDTAGKLKAEAWCWAPASRRQSRTAIRGGT
jgi:DNA-binding transcriptional regulator YdaS (Cro superfamily)